jgi:hypothetical protein
MYKYSLKYKIGYKLMEEQEIKYFYYHPMLTPVNASSFEYPSKKPENDILKYSLEEHYEKFLKFVNKINTEKYILYWNYIHNTNRLIGWIRSKNRNKDTNQYMSICGFLVCKNEFKITFSFIYETMKKIIEMEVDEEIKKIINDSKPIGSDNFLHLKIPITNEKLIIDIIKIMDYTLCLRENIKI